MIHLKCCFLLVQLLIVVTGINSGKTFFRGKYFSDDIQKIELKAGTSVEEKWHSQILDHFNASETRKWNQRYYVNEGYYGKTENSPIFLMIGGEGAISPYWMTGGFWVDKAKQHRALLLQLEHRFYGKSHPTEDVSTDNLQYLTVEQALHDAVAFIVAIQDTYKLQKNNKLILFGGSYPGNLVAWLRLKYPHLVYAAVSSSSPVLSVVDFKDYFKVVAESLGTYSRSCVTTITEAYASIDQLSQDQNGQQTLTQKFNLCEALENSTDFANDFAELNNGLANIFAWVVQYNKVDHSSNQTIDSFCNILTNESSGSTSLDRFATLVNVYLYGLKAECLEYSYKNFVDYYRTTDWENSASNGGRQWFFQTCHQMGYFQTSSNKPHVFGNKFPVERMIRQCADVFGPQYTAEFIEDRITRTNAEYGGKNIVNNLERVVFVDGSIDPWHALGVTHSSNPRSPALYIIGTAHCADMMSNSRQDLPQLVAAREAISGYIQTWLTSAN